MFHFTGADFVDLLSVKKKNWPLPRTVVCVCVGGGCGVCVCVGGGGGGGQDAIQTSTMTPLSATVSRVSTGVGGCSSGYKYISLSQRVSVYACTK